MSAQSGSGGLGVVVFQLGGPDSLAAVEPFLYNLFSDPDIIDFPFARLARPTLARLISSRRARHVAEHYAGIGGKSPIRELTERQASALERELRESRGLDARVVVAMRYWHPLTEAAVEQVARGNFRELILLPLYPQYSKTTTGSSLNEWRRRYRANGNGPIPVKTIHQFYDHPAYLDALVEKINQGLARFADDAASADARLHQSPQSAAEVRSAQSAQSASSAEGLARFGGGPASPPARLIQSSQSASSADDVWLVFSAHGVPLRVVEAGDPYQQHIEATVRLVMERGGWPNPHVLCYQSRVSPGKWLEPTLSETLRSLAASPGSGRLQADQESPAGLPASQRGQVPPGATTSHHDPPFESKALPAISRQAANTVEPWPPPAEAIVGPPRVLVVPISFVTDHVETLAEINIEARQLAYNLGIEHFELMPALNDSPAFIRALADLVLAQMDAPPRPT